MASTITGIMSYVKDYGFYFDRKQHPVIRRMLNGYIKNRPSEKRVKKPWMDIHMHLAFKYIINMCTYLGLVVGAGFCLGYWHGMRPGEYSISSHSEESDILRVSSHSFLPKTNPIKTDNIIILKRSKTNKVECKEEILAVSCTCNQFPTLPCATHWFELMFKKRLELFGSIKKTEPLLMLEDGKPLKASQVNNTMKTTIIYINSRLGLNLTTSGYAGHSMRVGGCTDKMRQKWTETQVKKWGRWSSDIWHKTYWSLDLRDFCQITKSRIDTVFVDNYKLPNLNL